VATTAGLGPYGGQAQLQRDAGPGDAEGSGVERFNSAVQGE
jgi:hypothetical protein